MSQSIGYGTSFETKFFDMPVTLDVISPVNTPDPTVTLNINYKIDKDLNVSSLKEFFIEGTKINFGLNAKDEMIITLNDYVVENLLSVLLSLKLHTKLLKNAEFGFLKSLTNDHQAILSCNFSNINIEVKRTSGILGTKDKVEITIGTLVLKKELDDNLFKEINQLKLTIDESKNKIKEKIEKYVNENNSI